MDFNGLEEISSVVRVDLFRYLGLKINLDRTEMIKLVKMRIKKKLISLHTN